MATVYKPKQITIDVEMDSMGGLTLTPQSDRIRRKIIKHLSEFGESSDGTVYIQTDYDVEHFIDDQIPRNKRDEIYEGYEVSIRMDPWIFGHYVGYDAHEVL